MRTLGTVGLVCRFRPLHNGSALMLDTLCANADHVKIGIGGSNKYDLRHPFTTQETETALHRFLKPKYDNYNIIHVPDFGHIPAFRDGGKWTEYVTETFGTLDYFVTANGYVEELLKDHYRIIHPASLIPADRHIRLRGTMVRLAMAAGGDYRAMMPPEAVDYYEQNGLVQRFRREFGLQTLALLGQPGPGAAHNAPSWWTKPADIEEEKNFCHGDGVKQIKTGARAACVVTA